MLECRNLRRKCGSATCDTPGSWITIITLTCRGWMFACGSSSFSKFHSFVSVCMRLRIKWESWEFTFGEKPRLRLRHKDCGAQSHVYCETIICENTWIFFFEKIVWAFLNVRFFGVENKDVQVGLLIQTSFNAFCRFTWRSQKHTVPKSATHYIDWIHTETDCYV